MKKKIIIITICAVILITVTYIGILLCNNKTFFKNRYIGVSGEEIYIPKYSYFKDECCMTAATFISLKSKKSLDKEIKNYMKNFTYFEDDTTYGYMKDDLFIQSYEVEDHLFYRTIIITY